MSEIKHTPGPWRVGAWSGRCHKPSHQGISHPGPRGNDPCVYTPEFVDGLHGIAADDGVHVVSSSYDGIAVTEADARLIAAAPEILAELESLYTWLGDYTFDWPGRCTEEGQSRLIRMRDLIAKATGQSEQEVQDDYGTRAAIARRRM